MSFDTLAPHYRWMERVFAGGLMQRSRAAFIDNTRHARHALIAGEGPGQFLEALLSANTRIRVTCVERSARMIQEARNCLARCRLDSNQVRFVQQDALTWPQPSGEFDLVVTHFFLDCFSADQLPVLVERLASGATSNATWLVADFCVPRSGWQRWRAQSIVALLYLFFQLTTDLAASRLTPPDPHLRAAGFRLQQRHHWSLGLLQSDFWLR